MSGKEERAEWLRARQSGMGGSDVAAILGLATFSEATPLNVYYSKVNKLPDEDHESEAMYWGNVHEPEIIKEYSRRTGIALEGAPGLLRHPDFPQLLATPDHFLGGNGILECKVATMGRDWGNPDHDAVETIPPYYYVQVLHYLDVTGRDWADLAVLIGGTKMNIYKVEDNPTYRLENRERILQWWEDFVVAGIEPPCVTVEDGALKYPVADPEKIVQADDTLKSLCLQMSMAKRTHGIASDDVKQFRIQIQEKIGDAELLMDGEEILVSWKNPRPSRRIDASALRTRFPDVYEQVCLDSKSSRRFLLHVDTGSP